MLDNSTRNAAQTLRFFVVDGRFAVFLLLFLLFPNMVMLYFLIGLLVFFKLINSYGFTFQMIFRFARRKLAGPVRFSRPYWRKDV